MSGSPHFDGISGPRAPPRSVIDPQTRLGWCGCPWPGPQPASGAFARAEVTVSNAQRIVLPQTAVLTDDKGSYVLVIDSQNKVERRPVKVSGMVANGVTIADGIGKDDRVVATAARSFRWARP